MWPPLMRGRRYNSPGVSAVLSPTAEPGPTFLAGRATVLTALLLVKITLGTLNCDAARECRTWHLASPTSGRHTYRDCLSHVPSILFNATGSPSTETRSTSSARTILPATPGITASGFGTVHTICQWRVRVLPDLTGEQ